MEIHGYEPLPKVAPFHQSRARYKILLGALGAGKSRAVCEDVIDSHMEMPGLISLVTRKYGEDLKDTTMKVFYEETQVNKLLSETWEGGKHCKINNGEVIFTGLYTRSKQRITKLGSYRVGKIAGDEVSEWAEEDFRMLQGRLRQEDVSHRDMVMATNPPNIDHWIYDKFVLNKGPEYELFKVSIYDNPYLPEDYVRNLEKDYAGNDSWVKRYLLGEFGYVCYGHPVYSGFTETMHASEELKCNPHKPILRGWDFGWHRPCVVYCQFDNDDRFLILDTVLGDKIYLEEFRDKILKYSAEKYPGCKFDDFCDIAGLQKTDKHNKTSIQLLQERDINPRYMKATIKRGVETVQNRISRLINGRPALLVDKNNRIAIEMFMGGYYYGKSPDGIFLEKPHKDGYYEHVADAIRYVLQAFYLNKGTNKRINIKEPSFVTNESYGRFGGYKNFLN
jgi:PBSX family phage terminase large subunit